MVNRPDAVVLFCFCETSALPHRGTLSKCRGEVAAPARSAWLHQA